MTDKTERDELIEIIGGCSVFGNIDEEAFGSLADAIIKAGYSKECTCEVCSVHEALRLTGGKP